MKFSKETLSAQAQLSGFRPDMLEKVAHLLSFLESIVGHPVLKGKMGLKGGTALNLFIFDVPRLSVDIDLNYIAAADKETMLADRPRIEAALQQVATREGFSAKRSPNDHAGGKWIFRYASAFGQASHLEVDLNFLLRMPLWPVVFCDSRAVGPFRARGIPLLDLHELAAGKLAALFARRASRDLYDATELLRRPDLDIAKLRLAFTVYGAASRTDWRVISPEQIDFDPTELKDKLLPVLQGSARKPAAEMMQWGNGLVAECRGLSKSILPLSAAETEFITRINDQGEIAADLLTDDHGLRAKIEQNPALQWKALNVRKHRGLER